MNKDGSGFRLFYREFRLQSEKNDATVDIGSLKETEGLSERVAGIDFENQRRTIKLGADIIRNECADRKSLDPIKFC